MILHPFRTLQHLLDSEWWLCQLAQALLFQVGRQLQNLYLSSIIQISLAICQLTVLVMQTVDKLQQHRPETAADLQSESGVQQVACQDLGNCCRVYIGLQSQTHQPFRPQTMRSLSTLQAYW